MRILQSPSNPFTFPTVSSTKTCDELDWRQSNLFLFRCRSDQSSKMGMAKRINKNHYIASSRPTDSPTPVHLTRSAAYSDGEESQRAPSERTVSEYTSVVRVCYMFSIQISIVSSHTRSWTNEMDEDTNRDILPGHHPLSAEEAPTTITVLIFTWRAALTRRHPKSVAVPDQEAPPATIRTEAAWRHLLPVRRKQKRPGKEVWPWKRWRRQILSAPIYEVCAAWCCCWI